MVYGEGEASKGSSAGGGVHSARRRWRRSRLSTVVVIAQMKLQGTQGCVSVGVWKHRRIRRTYKTARKVSEGREMAAKVRLSIRNNVMLCAYSVHVQSVSASLVAMQGGDIRGRSRARLSGAP